MELEVGRHRVAARDRRVERLDRLVDRLQVRLAAPLGRQPGRLDLDAAPQFHDRQHALDGLGAVGVEAERPPALVADHEHPGALPGFHEPLGP